MRAELPDGVCLEFPDDMTDAEVDARVRAYMQASKSPGLTAAIDKLDASINRLIAAQTAPREITLKRNAVDTLMGAKVTFERKH